MIARSQTLKVKTLVAVFSYTQINNVSVNAILKLNNIFTRKIVDRQYLIMVYRHEASYIGSLKS